MVLYAASPIIPGVVHACRESRALNLYERFILEPATTASYAWVNYDVDTIEIGENEHYIRFKHCGHKIRRLKIKANPSCEDYGRIWPSCGKSYFPNLLECFAVTSDDFTEWAIDVYIRSLCDEENFFVIMEQTGEIKCYAEIDLEYEEEWERLRAEAEGTEQQGL